MPPNLVAVKYGGGKDRPGDSTCSARRRSCNSSSPNRVTRSVETHECGLLISLGVGNPRRARRFFDARGDDLRRLGEELDEVCRAVVGSVGDAGHIDGAYDKLFVKLHLPEFPLRLRPPYGCADETRMQTFRAGMPRDWLPD